MPSIHLIERADNIRRRGSTKAEWESGDWVINDAKARALVAGHVYFHSGQKDRSHFGGIVTGYRTLVAPHPNAGRIVIEFSFDEACRNVTPPSKGWGNEQAYVK